MAKDCCGRIKCALARMCATGMCCKGAITAIANANVKELTGHSSRLFMNELSLDRYINSCCL